MMRSPSAFSSAVVVSVLILAAIGGCPPVVEDVAPSIAATENDGLSSADTSNDSSQDNLGGFANGGGSHDVVGTSDPCADFNLLKAETFPPSVVKLYFQLETCDGEPITDATHDQFIIEEDDEAVSDYESNQDFVDEPRPFELTTTLLLDMSGLI